MAKSTYDYTIGIEEEYMIVDPTTGELTSASAALIEEGKKRLGNLISTEMMKCQVEIGTPVCHSIQEAHQQLLHIRKEVSDLAKSKGLAIVAAGTHPFSKWDQQSITSHERYHGIELENQILARQLIICGMHMHIGIEDQELRVDLMNQLRYFCPHLLALSTSSPMWEGHDTGLKSYRSVIFERFPRSGIPPALRSWNDYQEYLDVAISTKSMDEPTKIRWDIRLSPRYPTLEFRICDVCTRVEDAIAICGLKVALVAKLLKLRKNNMQWREYRKELIQENKWRAVRYGLTGKLIDFGKKKEIDAKKLIFELLTFVDDVVDDLGIRDEVSHIHQILTEGTSAERQLRVFKEEKSAKAVVDMLIKDTLLGIE